MGMKSEVTSAIQPVMQVFMRLQNVQSEASKSFVLLPMNPQLLPVFIGCLCELNRIPRALEIANDPKDKDTLSLDKTLDDLRDRSYAEAERFMNALSNDSKDYRYDLKLHKELDIAYNEVYVVLAKKKLLMPTEGTFDMKQEMADRASE